MPVADTSKEGVPITTQSEHNSDGKSKKVTIRQFEPVSGDYANISATDNGDGTYSLDVDVTQLPSSSSATVTSVSDTTTSAQLIAANTSRKEVEFYNNSSSILFLLKGSGTASSTNYTVELKEDGYYSTDFTGAFQGVWETDAGGSVLITDST